MRRIGSWQSVGGGEVFGLGGGAGADVKLVENVGEMSVDGIEIDAHARGDFLVKIALRNKIEHDVNAANRLVGRRRGRLVVNIERDVVADNDPTYSRLKT
jgi:hypothetical protein